MRTQFEYESILALLCDGCESENRLRERWSGNNFVKWVDAGSCCAPTPTSATPSSGRTLDRRLNHHLESAIRIFASAVRRGCSPPLRKPKFSRYPLKLLRHAITSTIFHDSQGRRGPSLVAIFSICADPAADFRSCTIKS